MLATSLLLAANLLPILGVVFWGWDAFELLVLYWCETGVIAFWTILLVGLRADAAEGFVNARSSRRIGGLARAALFTVHTGLFMTVHMVFLWTLFSGDWPERVHGPVEFVDQLVIRNGAWLPLAVMFAVRGALTLASLGGPGLQAALGIVPGAPEPGRRVSPLRDLYGRIMTMQITILAGGWLAIAFDNRATAMLLVAVKILVDLLYDPKALKARKKQAVSKSAPAP